MGKVCRICDHKFFLRAKFENYSKEISDYQEEKNDYESELIMK